MPYHNIRAEDPKDIYNIKTIEEWSESIYAVHKQYYSV